MTFEDIRKANESISTMTISRTDKKTGRTTTKEYAEVNQRIKAFRMVFPEGFIRTEMTSNVDGVCIFRAMVGTYTADGSMLIFGTGTAYEKESSSFINSTSYIENCETSAVGRALGMAGFGIDTSVASYEEVANAMENQGDDEFASPDQLEILAKYYTGENLEKLLKACNIIRLQDISKRKASDIIRRLKK